MPTDSTPTTRLCSRCKEPFPFKGDVYCRACRSLYSQEYFKRNQAKIQAQGRERYEAHREEESRSRFQKRQAVKREVIDVYGGKCECCGEAHIEFLAIHHRNGGGKKHRMEASGVGSQFYRYLRRNGYPQKDELGVLCHNCNMSHGFYGYCPHQREIDSPTL